MVDYVVEVISSHLRLPLLILQPYHIYFDLFLRLHKSTLLLPRLLQESLDVNTAIIVFVAIDASFDIRANICPDHEGAELRHLTYSWPKSSFKDIIIYFEAQVLGS